MSDLICSKCQANWPAGTIVCWKCGTPLVGDPNPAAVIDADSSDQQHPLVKPGHKVGLPARIDQGAVHLLIVQLDQNKIPEDTALRIQVPTKSGPIIIGRPDYVHEPPLVPDINLEVVADQYVVGQTGPSTSRSHAALFTESGYVLRAGHGASIWIRHSGDDMFYRLGPGREMNLRDRDVIAFGHPKELHLRARIIF